MGEKNQKDQPLEHYVITVFILNLVFQVCVDSDLVVAKCTITWFGVKLDFSLPGP